MARMMAFHSLFAVATLLGVAALLPGAAADASCVHAGAYAHVCAPDVPLPAPEDATCPGAWCVDEDGYRAGAGVFLPVPYLVYYNEPYACAEYLGAGAGVRGHVVPQAGVFVLSRSVCFNVYEPWEPWEEDTYARAGAGISDTDGDGDGDTPFAFTPLGSVP